MKAKAREIYLILANEIDFNICSFCKFAESHGCGCDSECQHPLCDRVGFPHWDDGFFEPGDDCWGFRPEYDVSTVADIIGIGLSNQWTSLAYWKDEEGKLLVSGTKEIW